MEGVFDVVVLTLTEDLRERGKLDLREAFIDGILAGRGIPENDGRTQNEMLYNLDLLKDVTGIYDGISIQ